MAGTSYDPARRRRATRGGRDRGCRVYIPEAELLAAGIDPSKLPYFTTRGYQRSRNGHTVIVSLYREP